MATKLQISGQWLSGHTKQKTIKTPQLVKHWKQPDQGWIKVNADGAVSKVQDKGGGGVILRDHEGAYRGGAATFFPSATDPQVAEVLAARRGVKLATERSTENSSGTSQQKRCLYVE